MSANKETIKTDLKSTLKRLDAMKDEDIDYSDIPECDDDFFKNTIIMPPLFSKKSTTLRIDYEVLQWFKQLGKGYQTRINAVLKAYMNAHKNAKHAQ